MPRPHRRRVPPDVYIRYHHRLREVVETLVPVKKVQSIDELECELSGDLAVPARALRLAEQIRARIVRDVGPCLRCSIGIGPNWFIAKLASDLEKPDGLVLFDEADIPAQLIARNVQLGDFTGIGENMEQRLRAAGIPNVAALYAASSAQLRAVWGSVEGARFHDWLHGGLQEREATKTSTIGHSQVLPPEKRNATEALAVLHRLLQKAAMRLRHDGALRRRSAPLRPLRATTPIGPSTCVSTKPRTRSTSPTPSTPSGTTGPPPTPARRCSTSASSLIASSLPRSTPAISSPPARS